VAPPGRQCKIFSQVSDCFSQERHQTVTQPPRSIATPCVKVCIVDGASGLCLGCLRTLAEIGGWAGLTDGQRAAIMADLPARRARIDPALLG
jgi:predicted Fe-S protein YdhL (DUF1289 family)